MPNVLVAGGGLAGLIAARELQRHGFSVTVLERSERVGGKAGCIPGPNGGLEHGYHIFPPWYSNMRRIVRELQVDLVDMDEWHYLTPMQGGAMQLTTMKVPTTLREAWTVLRQSPVSIPETLLYFYFVIDMVGRPLSQKSLLDQISRLGAMRGRWYMTDRLPDLEQESILKASAIPVYEMSAYTAKLLSSFWLRSHRPFLSILPNDLQTALVDPLHRLVTEAGVDVRFRHEVMRIRSAPDGRIEAFEVRTEEGVVAMAADAFVVATPLDVSPTLLPSDVLQRDPDLGDITHLHAAPMAALHLTLARKLTDLPREHVFLRGGRYGLSFIDHSQNWPLPDSGQHTTLSFIASDFEPLQALPAAQQYALLFEEIARYLPITPSDVTLWRVHPNVDAKLFINTVGAWPNRPRVTSKVPNLFFAGDWVRNRVDLACMEGAAYSALAVARAVCERFAQTPGVEVAPGPTIAPRYPPCLVRLGVAVLAPFMVPLYLIARIGDFRRRRTAA